MLPRFMLESFKHCKILDIYAQRLMALEKKIFKVFPHDNPMETKDHWDMANFDSRDMVGRIYVEDL